MTDPRIIRIESVRFDALDAAFEGTAICREANGVLTRKRLTCPGNPCWTHAQAVRALARHVQTG